MRERPEATALLNPVRVQMLRWIGRSPGITQARLAALVAGVSRRYARHHLDVLARAGLIAVVRHRNANTYMLKGQPFLLPVDAASDAGGDRPEDASARAVPASELVAELNHPVRRLIFDALRLSGPCHYLEMVRAWDRMGVAQPRPARCDVTYHGKRLEHLGIVSRSRRTPHIVWSLRVDLKRLQEAEASRFLQNPHFQNIYDAARRSRKLGRRLFVGSEPSGDGAPTVADLLDLLGRVSDELLDHAGSSVGPVWPGHVRLPRNDMDGAATSTDPSGVTAGAPVVPPASYASPMAR